MRRYLCLLALFVWSVPATATTTRPLTPVPVGARPAVPAADGTHDHFTFVVSGDNRSTGRGVPQPPTPGEIFTEIRFLQPAFALWTGDTIYGSDDALDEAKAEYDEFLALAAKSATPLYNAPGNHEIFDRPEMAALYEARMGRLYGSFDYGSAHFIALDTAEVGIKGGLGKEQLEWLRQDLEANKNAKLICAFMHYPPFPKEEKSGWSDKTQRDAVHRLFVQYGVKHVFCGHEHLYYKSVQDGVTYWVSGGGGAPADAAPEEGGFQHYILFTVDGEKVSAVVLQPWRLFVTIGPAASDGTITALATNYNDADLPVSVEFPGVSAGATVTASWTYKGMTHPLEAVIVPSRVPGVTTVRVVVPKNRGATVTLHSKS